MSKNSYKPQTHSWLKLSSLSSSHTLSIETADFIESEAPDEFIRVSPIVFLNSTPVSLDGDWDIVFFYRLSPTKFLQWFESIDQTEKDQTYISFSWGLANCIAFIQKNKPLKESLLTSQNKERTPWEHWEIKDGRIINSEWKTHQEPLDNDLINLKVDAIETLELKSVFEEYLITIKNILVGCGQYLPDYVDYFVRLNTIFIENVLNNEKISTIKKTDTFVSTNASLSRLYSQLFSGVNGIINNPCPLSTHSLLGIGIANLALLKFCRFIEETIPEHSVDDLFDSIKDLPLDVQKEDSVETRISAIRRSIEGIRSGKLNAQIPGLPIIPFFSGRDGFKYAQLTNVSVPLMCLHNANRYSWNLLTITHELSHLLTDSFIEILKEADEDTLKEIYTPGKIIRKYGLTTYFKWALSLYETAKNELKKSSNGKKYDIHIQVSEILTHVVDYLFFYDAKTNTYFKYVWSSWLTVPDLEKRLQRYIVRTGAAILSANLEKDRESFVKEALRSGFEQMYQETENEVFTKILKEHINDDESWSETYSLITASIHLIELVKALLYDSSLAGIIAKETRILSGDQIYGFKKGELSNEDVNISNPIFFIKNYIDSDEENEALSLWVLLKIAFLENE